VHGHSLVAVLNDLGIDVAGGCVWHHDPRFDHGDAAADSLQHVVNTYGDFNISVCNKQTYELVNQLRLLKPDLFIVRHPGMAVWGAKLGIATFQVEDEHFALGYSGLLRFGNKIVDSLSNTSMVKNLARHARLPYTEWWLKQNPFLFIGGAV
jgi:nitrogenase molybdenum-iron protein alpha chain